MNPLWQVPAFLFFAMLLGTQLLHKTLDFTKPNPAKTWVTFYCITWLTLALEVLALPLTSWIFPLMGEKNSVWVGSGLLFVFISWLFFKWGTDAALEKDGSRKFWFDLWQAQEKLLLLVLPKKHHDQYHWHIRWRFLLLGRKIVRWWERLSIKDFLAALRWFWVVLAAIAAVGVIKLSLGDTALDTFSKQLTASPANAGVWSLLALLAGAPIAFALWKFRDTNTLWQIDNQRKDTNLKDFQQLSQWASGLHLIEAEKTSSTGNGESSETIKTSHAMSMNGNDSLRPPSRAEGAASLQIAAIYQLQSFLCGNFGPHFRKPAFALLQSLWLALVQEHTKKLPNLEMDWEEWALNKNKEVECNKWVNEFRRITHTPLAQALTFVLAQNHGKTLFEHSSHLPSIVFSGIDFNFLGLQQPVELYGLPLVNINLQGASLDWAQLQGANLEASQLQFTSFEGANLQCSNLQGAQLTGANLYSANLQGADLSNSNLRKLNTYEKAVIRLDVLKRIESSKSVQIVAKPMRGSMYLQGSNFHNAQLQDALLLGSQLQDASICSAQLQGTNFAYANLAGVDFTNSIFSSGTQFSQAKTDSHTTINISLSLEDSEPFTTEGKLLTHLLREKLRHKNKLELPQNAYMEHLAIWNSTTPEQQKSAAEFLAENYYKE